MSLIQHLSRHVTPVLKSQITDSLGPNVAIDSLLEQFYAIFATRISDSAMSAEVTQLATTLTGVPPQNIFAQVWTNQIQRDSIVRELADAHHINPNLVQQLVNPACDSAFQHIIQLANTNDQSIFDYLQTELEAMRAYLPTWAGTVIPMQVLAGQASAQPQSISQSAPVTQHTTVQNSDLHSLENNSHIQNPHNPNTPAGMVNSPNFVQNGMNPSSIDHSGMTMSGMTVNSQNIHNQNPLPTMQHNNMQPTNHSIKDQTHISPNSSSSPRASQSQNRTQQAQSRPRTASSAINPRANKPTSVNKQKKSLGLAMMLLPLLGVALIGGGAFWWMSGQTTQNNPQTITVASENTDSNTQNPETVKTSQNNANETLAKGNPNQQQGVTNTNDLNNQANGSGLTNGTATTNNGAINSAGQQITGVDNRGNQASIVYEFEPQTQGVDPNSLEELASTTIVSDSAPTPPQVTTPQTGQPIPSQATPSAPIEPPTKGLPIDPSVIGVEPDPENPLPEIDPKKKLPESSQKSAPRRTYSPITGKTLIITGNEL